jgi:hypothetical protein
MTIIETDNGSQYYEPEHSIEILYNSLYKTIDSCEGFISPAESTTIKNLTESILNLSKVTR